VTGASDRATEAVACEFRILGPLEVRLGGQERRIPGGRVREVLAVLLVHANHPVTADELADELWRQRAPESARSTVQVHVARLRRALGERLPLRTTPAGYVLEVAPERLDALAFERHVERAREGSAEDRAAELGRALELWRGHALAEFVDLPSVNSAANRLEDARLAALEARIDAELELGLDAELLPELQQLAAAHPYRERLQGLLMLALYRAGRQADALAVYREVRQRLVDELGIEPGPELRELERAVLAHDPALGAHATVAPAAMPPAPPTPTFGRHEELAAVTARLADDAVRLLTITGPGGVGKTRLAVEVARAAGGRFVALAATAAAAQVPTAVCDALELARVPDETAEAALSRVFAGRRALLVLDNFEHVLAAGLWLARLLDAAPALTVLVTSREPLGLRAEQRFPLEPLPLPPSVALFADRARARDPRVNLVNLEPVREICERLDGLPLAIELAAGRLGVLEPAALAARLTDVLGVLGSGARDAPERQQTLRATLDWSFGLLDADEQAAFAALGTFAGGGDLEAAEAITGADVAVLEGLVAKSLAVAKDGRLHLLEPVRQYAVEHLEARPDAAAVRARHAAHYLALAEETRYDIWLRKSASPGFERMQRERANLRAALNWAIEHGSPTDAIALAGAIEPYLAVTGAFEELHRLTQRALARADEGVPAALLARARAACAHSDDLAEVIKHAEVALELYRALGDDRGMAESLLRLNEGHTAAAEYPQGFAAAEEALLHAERTGDPALVGTALGALARGTPRIDDALPYMRAAVERLRAAGANERAALLLSTMGFEALAEDAFEQADELLAEALEIVHGLRGPFVVALVQGNRALAALLKGRLAEAAATFGEQAAVARAHELPTFYFEALLGFAALAAARSDDACAATLEAAALRYDDRGVWASEKPVYDRVDARFLGPARERLGHAAWERAGDRARDMTIEAALALAGDVRSEYVTHDDR